MGVGVVVAGVVVAGVDFTGVDFTGVDFTGVDFTGVDSTTPLETGALSRSHDNPWFDSTISYLSFAVSIHA